MFPKRGRVYLEMQAHVHLRVWEGGRSYPRNVASAASSSLATPAETSIIWTLNFISSIIYNICNNSVIPQGVKGTYQFSFFLHFKLQAEVQTISDFNCCSRLCIFYAGRHFQKLFIKSIKGLTCNTFNGHHAVSQEVSMAVFEICKILLTCSAMRLAVAKRSRPQDPVAKRHLEVFPSMKYLSLLFEKWHMLENIFRNCNILSRW